MDYIDGLIVTPLKTIEDDRGSVMHMLRSDEPHFDRFGEIYFSMIKPDAVKAWKQHTRMISNIAVPVGRVRLVAFDDRNDSTSQYKVDEFILSSESEYVLITIPPMVWMGFKNIGTSNALLANCANLPHDRTEVRQCLPDDKRIPYSWLDMG